MRFGHNFWLEGPIDLRPTRLNCILQDLFRDTPLDHIARAQICTQICIFGIFGHNNQSSNQNFQKLSMLQSCDGWADKMRCFFIRVWNTCTNLRKSTLLLICYFCCPFHCQSHSFPPKEPRLSVFAAEKNFLKPPTGTTLWYLSCAPGRARSANSSNVSVRPASCLDLPTQQTSQTVVVVGLFNPTHFRFAPV